MDRSPTGFAGGSAGEDSSMPHIENREHERRDVKLYGMLIIGEAAGAPSVACEVVNLSAGGAKVKLAEPVANPCVVVLDVVQLGKYPADVIWTSMPFLGLKFRPSPEVMAKIIRTMALFG